MPAPTAHDDPKMMQAAILHLLVGNYPANYSDQEVISQISRDPDGDLAVLEVTDAIRQLQADQLIRRHGRFWAASLAAIKAYALLEE